MNGISLKQVCEKYGVTRRAVQGYEKAGLVSPSGKNKYGHLLYDTYTQERIRQIKLYQELGFSIKEIVEIIDAPRDLLQERVDRRIEELKEELKYKNEVIRKVRVDLDLIE